MASILEKVLRVGEGRVLRRLENYAKAINALEEDFHELTDDELKNETVTLRERYSNGESLDDPPHETHATAARVTIEPRIVDASRMLRMLPPLELLLIDTHRDHQNSSCQPMTGLMLFAFMGAGVVLGVLLMLGLHARYKIDPVVNVCIAFFAAGLIAWDRL